MKKFLVLLLISVLALFVFAGCSGVVPGEGEGEGEGEIEEVTVEIDGSVVLEGKTYVSAGNHTITVTFPAPVSGSVSAEITGCTGYYGDKGEIPEYNGAVVLFPNEDKTVWSGSGYFGGYMGPLSSRQGSPIPINGFYNDCCASYVRINAGECSDDVCIEFPVIVDALPPYASIVIATDDECVCEDCDITFSIYESEVDCADNEACCGDDCSGLASWSIAVFDTNPFAECCTIPCVEPVFTCSGTDCPIECATGCLVVGEEGDMYYVIVSMVDQVGNENEFYATIEIESDCSIEVQDYSSNIEIGGVPSCTDWTNGQIISEDTEAGGYVFGYCGDKFRN